MENFSDSELLNRFKEFPHSIGPYTIDRLLKRGREYVLFLAMHGKTRDPYYIKVFFKKIERSPSEFSLFRTKLLKCMEAHCPYIQKVFDIGIWEGMLYEVLEFFESIPLLEYIHTNPLSLKGSVEIIEKIAEGLNCFHQAGLAFGALSLEKILVTEGDALKMIDGGLVPWTGLPASLPSYYLSPELEADSNKYNERADLYAWGVVAYEVILASRSQGVFNLNLLPGTLQKVLSRALQVVPEDRYQTIDLLLADLHVYQSEFVNRKQADTIPKQMNQLYDTLKALQHKILPPIPYWENADIGIVEYHGIDLTGVYYDFFKISLDSSYGIILGETVAKGIEGIFSMALLKGMITTLAKNIKDPREFVKQLNEFIVKENLDMPLNLSFIKLNPQKRVLYFISCGYAKLFYLAHAEREIVQLSTNNFALGIHEDIELESIENPWNPGDQIFINTYGIKNGEAQSNLRKELLLNREMKIQELVETIFQKSKKWMGKNWIYTSLTLVGIRYVDRK